MGKKIDKFFEGEWVIVLILFIILEVVICGAIWSKVILPGG